MWATWITAILWEWYWQKENKAVEALRRLCYSRLDAALNLGYQLAQIDILEDEGNYGLFGTHHFTPGVISTATYKLKLEGIAVVHNGDKLLVSLTSAQ